jgi:GNAT superfamily N-acetyltransferase
METIIIDNSEEITITKQYNNVTLELFYCKESDFYMATANVEGNQIATAMFEYAKWLNGWCGNEIEVNKKYRRQGIMTELYNWVEEKVNEKIVPTKTLTKASRAFWTSRNN